MYVLVCVAEEYVPVCDGWPVDVHFMQKYRVYRHICVKKSKFSVLVPGTGSLVYRSLSHLLPVFNLLTGTLCATHEPCGVIFILINIVADIEIIINIAVYY